MRELEESNRRCISSSDDSSYDDAYISFCSR